MFEGILKECVVVEGEGLDGGAALLVNHPGREARIWVRRTDHAADLSDDRLGDCSLDVTRLRESKTCECLARAYEGNDPPNPSQGLFQVPVVKQFLSRLAEGRFDTFQDSSSKVGEPRYASCLTRASPDQGPKPPLSRGLLSGEFDRELSWIMTSRGRRATWDHWPEASTAAAGIPRWVGPIDDSHAQIAGPLLDHANPACGDQSDAMPGFLGLAHQGRAHQDRISRLASAAGGAPAAASLSTGSMGGGSGAVGSGVTPGSPPPPGPAPPVPGSPPKPGAPPPAPGPERQRLRCC